MAIAIVAPTGVFSEEAEPLLMRAVYDALLVAVDGTDDERVASTVGVVLHVVPKGRVAMGGATASSVTIDALVPGIALASFRRRRRFIADATAAVVKLSTDKTIEPRVVVRIMHAADGGWGIGGKAYTNDEMDEGPE